MRSCWPQTQARCCARRPRSGSSLLSGAGFEAAAFLGPCIWHFWKLLAVLTVPAIPRQAGLIPVTSFSHCVCKTNTIFLIIFFNNDVMPYPGSPAEVTATSAFCPQVEVRAHSALHYA